MTEPTDAEVDASLDRALALIESMPVEQNGKLIAAMVALVEASSSRSDAACAFATAASRLSGGVARVIIAYGSDKQHYEVFTSVGTASYGPEDIEGADAPTVQ